jgi:anti-sigma B factor antagonist
MPLTIQMTDTTGEPRPSAVIVRLQGSLDSATAPELERQLEAVLDGPTRDVVFDLTHLQFISSAGLRVFGKVRKRLRLRVGETSFVNMQPQIAEVFEIVRALPGMAVFANIEELDRYLAARQRLHLEES